jgi:hypothetical protein
MHCQIETVTAGDADQCGCHAIFPLVRAAAVGSDCPAAAVIPVLQ